MPVHALNPLEDPRWPNLVERHLLASVFHTRGWLRALQATYNYEPIVYTTCAPEMQLSNGIAFCLVKSWVTGSRMVSLPFADHCEPLIELEKDRDELLSFLAQAVREEKWKYAEIRPLRPDFLSDGQHLDKSGSFEFHVLDLRPPLETLFRNLQKDSIQRKIKRAERESVRYERGNSEQLLEKFYSLFLRTRRRHSLPPQPIEWFRNLCTFLSDQVTIHVASYGAQPIASILTLRHRETLVYKYGCSNAEYHNLGGMPFLFWKAIQEAKSLGLQSFDLGRSDSTNPGLITFKDRLGASRSVLTYRRISARRQRATKEHKLEFAKRVFALMPDALLTTAGKLLYRHVA